MKIEKFIAPASAGIFALGLYGCAESTNETAPSVYLPDGSCEALGNLATFMETPHDNHAEMQAQIDTIYDLSSPKVEGTLTPFGTQHEAAREAANNTEVVLNLSSDAGAAELDSADWQLIFRGAVDQAQNTIDDTSSAYCNPA